MWEDIIKTQVTSSKQGYKTSSKKLPEHDEGDCMKKLLQMCEKINQMNNTVGNINHEYLPNYGVPVNTQKISHSIWGYILPRYDTINRLISEEEACQFIEIIETFIPDLHMIAKALWNSKRGRTELFGQKDYIYGETSEENKNGIIGVYEFTLSLDRSVHSEFGFKINLSFDYSRGLTSSILMPLTMNLSTSMRVKGINDISRMLLSEIYEQIKWW